MNIFARDMPRVHNFFFVCKDTVNVFQRNRKDKWLEFVDTILSIEIKQAYVYKYLIFIKYIIDYNLYLKYFYKKINNAMILSLNLICSLIYL
jgi:hypothetical protein